MKMLTCLLFLLCSVTGAAQGTVAKIIAHVSNDEVAEARLLVDAHWEVDSVTQLVQFWYFSAYVYKRLYEKANSNDSAAKALGDSCLEALSRASEAEEAEMYLDKIQRLAGGLLPMYFDAAIAHVRNGDYLMAEAYFEQFKRHVPIAGRTDNARKAHIKFYRILAKAYGQEIQEQSKTKEGVEMALIQKAIGANEEVLTKNENSYFALYNLGMLHMQIAQRLVKQNEEKGRKEAEKAEYYLKKAEQLKSDGAATEALLHLYEQTGNKEAAEVYREKLKKK